MSVYFFNTHSGENFYDQVGIELSGLDEARTIAIRHTGEIFQDETAKLMLEQDWRLEVLNESGTAVFEIEVHLHSPHLIV